MKMDKYDLIELKKAEKYAKRYNLSIVGICRNCNEHWTTMSEVEGITECETCKEKGIMENYFCIDKVNETLMKIEAKAQHKKK